MFSGRSSKKSKLLWVYGTQKFAVPLQKLFSKLLRVQTKAMGFFFWNFVLRKIDTG
jgi:hypothetical protein